MAPDSVPTDRAGVPRTSLICTDGDPTCDLDGRNGFCHLRLWSCLAGADPRLGCSAQQVAGAFVRAPAATATRPTEVAARSALLRALAALDYPVGPGERCTPPIEIDLPVRPSWLELKVEVPLAAARARDRDTLRLKCVTLSARASRVRSRASSPCTGS